MTDIDRLKQKLSKYEFCYDNEFHFFQQTDYHRDFEMYITDTQNKKLRILVKGVVQLNYSTEVRRDSFSLEDKYIQKECPEEVNAYHWGIRSFEISNLKIEDDSAEIVALQKDFDFKLFKLTFNVNSCIISFIFNDLEIKELS
ncbi:hypothetical protein CGC56_05020 [Capnocytophaga canimorsus]|uniref:YxiG-like domain-containing protein n=1 Tax=Capnocytophaga canimorsus TaxID=28188 RepID=A0A250G5R9_9FLAO|nr:hypothetical protein [Capnocytophaga canimorsus]ATA91586.1 hypothetical protein CGC56_05020 [Capnocytophaga canimorsus]